MTLPVEDIKLVKAAKLQRAQSLQDFPPTTQVLVSLDHKAPPRPGVVLSSYLYPIGGCTVVQVRFEDGQEMKVDAARVRRCRP